MIILYGNMFTFFLLNIKCEKKTGYKFFYVLINYFIYLYNFKTIYDVTGSTIGLTPIGSVIWEPLSFLILSPIQFLKPCEIYLANAKGIFTCIGLLCIVSYSWAFKSHYKIFP